MCDLWSERGENLFISSITAELLRAARQTSDPHKHTFSPWFYAEGEYDSRLNADSDSFLV